MDAATGQLCARARFWASLRLDGELSELESALLDAHLVRCADCREVADGFSASAAALRAEQPVVPAPVSVGARRRVHRVFLGAAAAAAVIAAALVGGLLHGTVVDRTAAAPHVVAVVASAETADQIRRLRRPGLLNERRLPRDLAVPV